LRPQEGAEGLRQIQPQNPMWKKMIKDTKWFDTYEGGSKKAVMMVAQVRLVAIFLHFSSTFPSFFHQVSIIVR
jgi:hypothetical protein